jgi:hypothetical protein
MMKMEPSGILPSVEKFKIQRCMEQVVWQQKFNALQQPLRPLPSWQIKTYPKQDAGTSPMNGLFVTIIPRRKTPTAHISRWEGI